MTKEGPPSARACLLVSACLLGLSTRFDRGHKCSEAVLALVERFTLVPVCPEQLGGLPTPRVPAEIQQTETTREGGVIVRAADGRDVSEDFERGAQAAVAVARIVGARAAVLKARSPSCGVHETFDGSFTNTLRPGPGVAAAALRDAGLGLYTEEDIAAGRGPV